MLLYAYLPSMFAFYSLKVSTSSGEVAGSGLLAGKEAKGYFDHKKTGHPTDLEPWTIVPTFFRTRRGVSRCLSWVSPTGNTMKNSLSPNSFQLQGS